MGLPSTMLQHLLTSTPSNLSIMRSVSIRTFLAQFFHNLKLTESGFGERKIWNDGKSPLRISKKGGKTGSFATVLIHVSRTKTIIHPFSILKSLLCYILRQ